MGGRSTLEVLLKGGGDLEDCILSKAEGGRKLEVGLSDLTRQRHGVHVAVTREPAGPSGSLREEIERALEQGVVPVGRPDVMLFSTYDDLSTPDSFSIESYRADMDWVVRTLKREMGSHLIFLNASTVDPNDLTANYHGLPRWPFSPRAHQVDAVLMELSFTHGISIIDADRVLAELGASNHVVAPLDYSLDACRALCTELVRILEDYGFFEERPLVMQMGQSA